MRLSECQVQIAAVEAHCANLVGVHHYSYARPMPCSKVPSPTPHGIVGKTLVLLMCQRRRLGCVHWTGNHVDGATFHDICAAA